MLARTLPFLVLAAALTVAPGASATTDASWSVCSGSDPDRALTACTAIIQNRPPKSPHELARTYNARGNAHSAKSENEDAVADFSEAILIDPNFAPAFSNRGNVAVRQDAYERAIADFDQAIRHAPTSTLYLGERGNAHMHMHQFDLAIVDFSAVIRLSSDSAQGWQQRAHAYGEKGDFDRAIADDDAAIRLDGKDASALAHRGSMRLQKNDDDGAIADLDAAITLNPRNASSYKNRGKAYADKGAYSRAIDDFEVAIRFIPKYREAILSRGLAREKSGNASLALADFHRALELKADDTDALAGIQRLDTAATAAPAAVGTTPAASATPPVIRAAAAAAPAATAAQSEKRIALVIGNSNYRSVALLPNPQNDAEKVAQSMTALGFAVTTKNDLTREALTDALAEFAAKSETADWAVIYYAGHGIEMGGQNYLIPIDAKLATDTSVQFEAIPLTTAMSAVDGAHKLRLIILDACRANPFASRMHLASASRAPTRGLARPPETDPGMLVFYAAKDGETASDGADGTSSSPFAAALVKELATPGVEVRRLFDLVSDDVFEATGGHQHPLYYGHLPGREDFVFQAKK